MREFFRHEQKTCEKITKVVDVCALSIHCDALNIMKHMLNGGCGGEKVALVCPLVLDFTYPGPCNLGFRFVLKQKLKGWIPCVGMRHAHTTYCTTLY